MSVSLDLCLKLWCNFDSPGYGRFKHLTHPWHQNCIVCLQARRTLNYYDKVRTELHSDLTS